MALNPCMHVYTHNRSYKICLEVNYTNEQAQHEGRHISAFIHFMEGEFDDELKWPFCGVNSFRYQTKILTAIACHYISFDAMKVQMDMVRELSAEIK